MFKYKKKIINYSKKGLKMRPFNIFVKVPLLFPYYLNLDVGLYITVELNDNIVNSNLFQ